MDTIKELLISVLTWCLDIVKDVPVQSTNILESHTIDLGFADSVAANILPIGISLMVLFFIIEFTSKCINPEWITYQNVTMFILKGMIFKQILTSSSDLLTRIFNVSKGIFNSISNSVSEIDAVDISAIEDSINSIEGGFQGIMMIVAYFLVIGLMAIFIIGSLIYVRIIIYGIFIEILIYKSLAPIAMSTLVSENISSTGKRFLQGYAAVCLQASVIVLSSLIFSTLIPQILMFGTAGSGSTSWESLLGFCTVVLCYAGTLSKSGSISKSMLGL